MGQGQQSCQKWKKSKTLFKSYRVNKNLQVAATAVAAYEPLQKHKVTPGRTGWLNKVENFLFEFSFPVANESMHKALMED